MDLVRKDCFKFIFWRFHEWGSWELWKEMPYTNFMTRERTCGNCGLKEKRIKDFNNPQFI